MKAIGIVLALLFLVMPIALAVDFNAQLSSADKATFDQILEPVMKVYNMVKYIASVVAVLVLLVAALTYMTSGSDPKKRDKAKNMGMYVLLGLVVIWAAPIVVNYIVG